MSSSDTHSEQGDPRPWQILFWSLAAARFLSCIPFVIDDDEAWRSVAARSLSGPFNYYLKSVDNKPPGLTWFYQLAGSDPRVARALFSVLIILAALCLGKLSKSSLLSRWRTSVFFLFATVLASPKMFAVTDDGLMSVFVIFSYALIGFGQSKGRWWVAGALFGAALMVKQTAVLFFLPLLPMMGVGLGWPFFRANARRIVWVCACAAVVYISCACRLGFRDFVYWNWTYPSRILAQARSLAFDEKNEFSWSVFEFSAAMLPLIVGAFFSRRLYFFRDFRWWWLLSSLVGVFLGRALFLHYFILAAAPLSSLAADGWIRFSPRASRLGVAWLIAGYGFAVMVVLLPFSGLFWGNDLSYNQAVGKKIRALAGADKRVLLWGGSTLPLAYSGSKYPGRFIIPRLAEPPYDTEYTRELYHRELGQRFPEIIVDLHERGDNRFNNPLSSDPFISQRIAGYHAFVSPAIPWAKFYLSFDPPTEAHLVAATSDAIFPDTHQEWDLLRPADTSISRLLERERQLRIHDSLVLLGQQGATPAIRAESARLQAREVSQAAAEDFFNRASQGDPDELVMPWRSPLWWAQSAIVGLQPKFYRP